MNRILIAEDKESHRQMLLRALEGAGFAVDTSKDGREALARLQQSRYAVLITDLRMPELDGLQLLKRARALDPQLAVLLMTAYGTVSDAVAAIREGAYDFLTKPVDPDHLVLVVRRILEERQREREGRVRREREEEPALVGDDPAMAALLSQLERVAGTDSTVLLLGESGTGKELFACRLHYLSPRRERLFLPINCAAIPEGLIESELFGYERGAFTGADSRRLGKFELAEGGTLFLDEIGELPLHLQVKLLRVLQERELMRVGGQATIPVDVRVVAASNRDLESMVREGRFRADLYYRLSVFPLQIPPLRKRPGDIPLLAQHFLQRIGRELGRPRLSLSAVGVERLLSYGWPGNVRELANTIERAAILCAGDEIQPEHLIFPGALLARDQDWVAELLQSSDNLKDISEAALRKIESAKIQDVLQRAGGNKSQAARILKVSYKTLLTKIKDLGLDS
jgi:DNA-binding NtrC family response regulator